MTPSREALALCAAAFCGVQVGAATAASRAIVPVFGPGPLAILRYALAVACLLPIVLLRRPVRFAPADLAAIAILGVVQFGVLIALLNAGLLTVPASRAATLFATFPLMTMVAAAIAGQERITAAKTGGIALTIAGVAVTLGEGLSSDLSGPGPWLVLAAAAIGGGCAVLYRPYLARYPALPVGFAAMVASVLALTAFVALFAEWPDWARPGARDWALVGFVGVSSGVGYSLWLWALKTTTPTRVTVFQALGPVTAAILGVLTLGETLGPGSIVGVGAVAAGLWLTTRPSHAPGLS